MPRMKCPRCATIVDVAPGGSPVCPNCGFGATAPPAAAPMAAPVAAAPSWGGSQMSPPPMAAPTGAPAASTTSGKAIASLVLGIVAACISIYLGIICGIIGLILGILALKQVNNSNGMVRGKGLAIAGIILSSIGILFQLIVILFFSALIAGALGGDWEKIQECAEDPDAPGCEEYESVADDRIDAPLTGFAWPGFPLDGRPSTA